MARVDGADGARAVLKEVQNALADERKELTVSRALGGWKAGGRVERDFAAAKEEFSKTKFVYLEMSTKHEFVSEIVSGGSCEDKKVDAAQQELVERKSNLKKVKNHCKAVKEEMETALAQTLLKREELQAEVSRLSALLEGQNDAAATQADIDEMEGRIAQKNEVLKEQEDALRDLNNEKQELEVAVRGLEQESAALAETAVMRPDDVRNRRMGAWLESANAVISKFAGVESVEVRDEEVDVILDVTAYNGTARKTYTLTLVIGQGHDVGFSEMRLEPADVDMMDLEVAWLAESSSSSDLAHLLQEVRNRLSCRMALEQELTGWFLGSYPAAAATATRVRSLLVSRPPRSSDAWVSRLCLPYLLCHS
jgi:myosin heavy subunit